MDQAFNDVLAFHRAFGVPIGTVPSVPGPDVVKLRVRLIAEEIAETVEAIDTDDLPGIADGIADTIYVLIGAAVAYGIDLPAVWDEVQRANLAKVGGPVRADGKRLKPENWVPPDIAGILERQHPIS